MRCEQEIVKDLVRGNARAFDEVYDLYCDRIWRFLMRLTRDAALSEDLFQETWLAVASHAHRLREDTSLVRWIYTIARNAYRLSWRRHRADLAKRMQLYYAIEGPRSPDGAITARIEIRRVDAAMMRLPEAFREVIVLCCLEDLSSEDAAAILEISKEAVRKRLSRARAELAAALGKTRTITTKRKSS